MRRVLRLAYFIGFLGLFSASYARISRSSSVPDSSLAPVLVESAPARTGGLWDRIWGRTPKEEAAMALPASAPAQPVSPPVLFASAGPSPSVLLDTRSDGVLVREVTPGLPERPSRGAMTDSDGRRYEIYGPRPREQVYIVKDLPSPQRFPPPAPTQVEIAAQKHLGYFGIFGTLAAAGIALALVRLYWIGEELSPSRASAQR